MRIIWTELALLDAENIKAYIERDSDYICYQSN